jgi:hypothetical protein
LEDFSTTQPVFQPALTQPPVIQPGLSRVIHYVPNMVLNIQPSSQPDCSPPPQPASQSASQSTAKKPGKRGPKPKPVDVEKNEQIEFCSIKYVYSDDLHVNYSLNNSLTLYQLIQLLDLAKQFLNIRLIIYILLIFY